MRTICYVDGYNLYYGCLKHTDYKWLDLAALLTDIVHEHNPDAELVQVKYFTADVLAKLSTHGQAAHQAQQDYLRALQLRMGDQLEVIKGFYALSKGSMLSYQSPPSKAERVNVWRLEEKETDVNIALHAYGDAMKQRTEQMVFVSNDTDLAPVLQTIRAEQPLIQMGVVFPILRTGIAAARPGNVKLSQSAHWTRKSIHEGELARAQLPVVIPTARKAICKPAHW